MIRCDIDESALSKTDRLGLAWCRLNCFEWDELVGTKPSGFNMLPEFAEDNAPSKYQFVIPEMNKIENVIDKANLNRYWWMFALGRSEEEWREWYWHDRLEYQASVFQKPFYKIRRFWKGGNGKKGCREKLKDLPAAIRSFFGIH